MMTHSDFLKTWKPFITTLLCFIFSHMLLARSALSQTDRVSDIPIQLRTFVTSTDLGLVAKGCDLNPFLLFEGPNINNLTSLDIGCPETVDAIAASSHLLTSTNFYYLSEIEDLIGGVQNLPCFLKAVGDSPFGAATLVIDKVCTLSTPLILPSRFTLAGTGIEGDGQLRFNGLPDGVAAVRLDSEGTDITIRDLPIGNLDGGIVIGVDLSRANKVFLRDVMVTGFFAGIYGSRPGTTAISVYLDRCSVFDNDFNIVLHRNAFHWRIRDGIFNQATCWGMYIFGAEDDPAPPPVMNGFGWGNDYVVDGCRFEGCGQGGVSIGTYATLLSKNRFEQNGGVGGIGVRILSSASGTRMMSNIFISNLVIDNGDDTLRWGDLAD